MRGVNHQSMNETNKFLILKTIATHGSISRIQLSQKTNLSKMTITVAVNDYIKSGIVRECGTTETSSGRKPTLLEVIPESLLTLGISVGRDYLQVGIIDLKGQVKLSDQIPMSDITSEQSLKTSLVAICDNMLMSVDQAKVWGIGISSIGPINLRTGAILSPPNSQIKDFEIVSFMNEKYSFPVYIENDMAVSALAEMYFGEGKGFENFAYVGVTAGIGGGIIIGQRLYSGTAGLAGVVGHIIVESQGEKCGCGQIGCLEASASIRAITNWVRQNGNNPNVSWLDILGGAEKGDPLCVQAIDRMCNYLRIGLINIINAFDPQCILIGGELWFADSMIIKRLEREVNENVFASETRGHVVIQRSHFPGNASFIGTAALVMENNQEYRRDKQ